MAIQLRRQCHQIQIVLPTSSSFLSRVHLAASFFVNSVLLLLLLRSPLHTAMAKKRSAAPENNKKKKTQMIDRVPKHSQQPRSSPPKRRTDFSFFMRTPSSLSNAAAGMVLFPLITFWISSVSPNCTITQSLLNLFWLQNLIFRLIGCGDHHYGLIFCYFWLCTLHNLSLELIVNCWPQS